MDRLNYSLDEIISLNKNKNKIFKNKKNIKINSSHHQNNKNKIINKKEIKTHFKSFKSLNNSNSRSFSNSNSNFNLNSNSGFKMIQHTSTGLTFFFFFFLKFLLFSSYYLTNSSSLNRNLPF